MVIKQQYPSGTKLDSGSEITLTLGKTQEATTTVKRVEVPALINYTEEKAEEILKGMGVKVSKAYATSDTVKKGYVIKQSPKGGSIVDKGFEVTITISKGVAKVKVPLLIGLSQSAAQRELNNVGLELGSVSSDYSGEVGVGDVISQGIDSGTSVDKGTKVPIVISLGERESYRYEGSVTIDSQPFEEDDASGSVKLVLEQDNWNSTIYSQSNISNDDFPLEVTFEGKREGSGTVTMYIDGEKYKTYEVSLSAIAD